MLRAPLEKADNMQNQVGNGSGGGDLRIEGNGRNHEHCHGNGERLRRLTSTLHTLEEGPVSSRKRPWGRPKLGCAGK